MEDLVSFLPFIGGDSYDLVKKDNGIRRMVKEMLELFCKISGLVIEYLGKGMLGRFGSTNCNIEY